MKTIREKIIFAELFFCLLPNFLLSQVNDSAGTKLYSLTLEELLDIKITTVSKKPESALIAPQTVIVITEEDIIKRGYIDLEQLFHDLPGFDISRGNGTGYSNIYQRGYRSNNTDRTLLLIDGVEENDLWSGNIWMDRQYPLSNIKRIEIIYGPSSTIYGANAFIGVVNIITKDADEFLNKDNKIGINAQVNYGTWNTKYADITAATKLQGVSVFITARHFTSNEMDLSNYEDWDYNLDKYDVNFYLKQLNTQDTNLAIKAKNLDNKYYFNDPNLGGKQPKYSNKTQDWFINSKIKINEFTIGLQTWQRDHGYGSWYRDDYELGPFNGGKWVANNSFIYANYEKKINEKLSISSFTRGKIHRLDDDCKEYYYTGYLNKGLTINNLLEKTDTIISYNSTLHSLDTTINKANSNPYWWIGWFSTYSQQISNELKVDYNPLNNLNFILGTEIKYSHVQGQYITSEKEFPSETGEAPVLPGGNYFASRDYGFFAQGSYNFHENLKFVFGGRLDNNRIRENQGYGSVFNPKLGIIYSPKNFVFKLLYSEAYKDAGFWTKYGTTPARKLTNPTLPPEKVKNAEICFSYKISSNLLIDVSAYQAFYSGVVSTAIVNYVDENGNQTTTQQHQAIGSLDIKGIQANINYRLKNYDFFGNFTYTNPYNTENGSHVRIGDIANSRINAGVNAIYFKNLNLNFRLNYVSDRPTGAGTTINKNPLNKIDGATILYGAIKYNISKIIAIQFDCNNILNTEYFDPGVRSAEGDYYAAKMPQNRRNFMIKILFKI